MTVGDYHTEAKNQEQSKGKKLMLQEYLKVRKSKTQNKIYCIFREKQLIIYLLNHVTLRLHILLLFAI